MTSDEEYSYETDDERTVRELTARLHTLLTTEHRPGLATWTAARGQTAIQLREALNRVIDGAPSDPVKKALQDAAARVEWLREMYGVGIDAAFFARGIRAMMSEAEDADFVASVRKGRESWDAFFAAQKELGVK